ncbi:glycoside hydrolase family 3 C-terminal domain-containing protein [Flavitalea flava]
MIFKLKTACCIISIMISACGFGQKQASYPFQDPSLSVDTRAADLVGRLTLSEKLNQLFSHSPAIDRLGIPEYNWWNEGLHGVARAGTATVFPQAIGLSASFNEDLMLEVAMAISDEARAKHNFFIRNGVHSIYTGLTFWSPNINIFRDPRWGRGQETYGEDPFLTGRMAVNFIRGLQGDDPRYLKTIATAKHYAVHSGPEFSRHQDDVFVDDRDLYETYLPAFKSAVIEGHVQSVMCAYNRFRDQPCCGSNLLLSHILRDRFGFTGYVVSDCGAISDFYEAKAHHVVNTPAKAWGWSLSAGTDVNCEESKAFIPENIDSAVSVGIINEADINLSLKRLLRARFLLGMFDPEEQVVYNKIPLSTVGSKEHQALALKAATQSIVLLKNNGVLPLQNVHKISIIGPNADNGLILLGNYNGLPVNPVTPLKALQQRLGSANVFYSAGCAIVKGVYTNAAIISGKQLFHLEQGRLKGGLTGSYFGNTRFEGVPALVRTDTAVDFHWVRSPVNAKWEDSFSVRWTGLLVPAVTGVYTFSGNVLLQINHQPVKNYMALEAGKRYEIEASLVVEPFWWGNTIEPAAQLLWVDTSRNYEKEALDVAAKGDVVIFCGGISSQLEGEEMPLEIDGFSHGDRTHINLPAVQESLLMKLKKTGRKIVYINFSGSAVALNWEDQSMDGIIQAFYPGEAGGTALVNTLFGDSNPAGRLPMTFYKSVDDLPPFKNYAMKGRTYRYFTGEPLYPFGYGLSFSSFRYSNLRMPQLLSCGDSLQVTVTITNTGNRDAGEVAELYLSHRDSSTITPLQTLVGFKRVMIKKGESKNIAFTVRPEQMSIIDNAYRRMILPGEVVLFAGGTLPDRSSLKENKVISGVIKLTGQPVPVQ